MTVVRLNPNLLLRGAMNRAAAIGQSVRGNLHHVVIGIERLNLFKRAQIRRRITEARHQHALIGQIKSDIACGKAVRIEF